ncbi:MAG: FHA domain-containing protein [Deltaproteobacteria bacterium]|nr:FHA domain-containing protein [Deltaproteobacteria bacterium]
MHGHDSPKSAITSIILAVTVCLSWSVGAFADDLKVRMYDADRYREHGELLFVVDARNDGVPIENLARGTWSLEAAGQPVDMKVKASTFRSAGMPTSVLVILPATPNFSGDEEIADDATRQRPIRFVLEAVSSLKTSLGQSDLVTIHCYDETRPEPVALASNRKVSRLRVPTTEEVDAKCRSDSADSAGGQPRLQTLLLGSIQKWLAKRPSSGREVKRFVVVVFTDGVSKEAIQDKWFRPIQRGFSDPTGGWIELYVIGLEDGGDPANLQALARAGVLASAPVRQDIPDQMTRLAPLISGAGLYSLDYQIEDSVEGQSVTFTIGVDGGGSHASGNYTIADLERKTKWLAIVLYVVGALVGVILLFLVIRLIASAVAARRQRLEEEAEAMASQHYEGPSRGRLIVRDGPATGETFHLLEDLTYIGRSPENEISLPDPSVGKRHASIRIKDRSYTIEDLQSVNGVFVNGQRVLKANLKNGDSIRMGGTEMQFSL